MPGIIEGLGDFFNNINRPDEMKNNIAINNINKNFTEQSVNQVCNINKGNNITDLVIIVEGSKLDNVTLVDQEIGGDVSCIIENNISSTVANKDNLSTNVSNTSSQIPLIPSGRAGDITNNVTKNIFFSNTYKSFLDSSCKINQVNNESDILLLFKNDTISQTTLLKQENVSSSNCTMDNMSKHKLINSLQDSETIKNSTGFSLSGLIMPIVVIVLIFVFLYIFVMFIENMEKENRKRDSEESRGRRREPEPEESRGRREPQPEERRRREPQKSRRREPEDLVDEEEMQEIGPSKGFEPQQKGEKLQLNKGKGDIEVKDSQIGKEVNFNPETMNIPDEVDSESFLKPGETAGKSEGFLQSLENEGESLLPDVEEGAELGLDVL